MSKYNAVPTRVNGIRFDSRKEAERYEQLLLLERVGQIASLTVHPKWDLHAVAEGGEKRYKVSTYTGDFWYWDYERGRHVLEDVKGVRTQVYMLKKRWMKAEYGIDITEV